jgi:hypothetical protein
VSDTTPAAKGIRIPLTIARTDKVGDVGIAMTTIGRNLANAVLNEFAQNPGDYDVDIVVTLRKKD